MGLVVGCCGCPRILERKSLSIHRQPFERLDFIFQCIQKPRTVLVGKACIIGLRLRHFTNLLFKLPHAQGHADIVCSKRVARRADDTRLFFPDNGKPMEYLR